MKRIPTRIALLVITASLTLTSCAVLTDSQVKNINAFASAASSYSAFPSTVLHQRADFHLHNEFVVASGFTDPDAIGHRLDTARKYYNNAVQISSRFDLSLQLIQQYAGLLAKLSSDHYFTDLNAPTAALGQNLCNIVTTYNSKCKDTLPSNLGTTISRMVLLVGKQLTKHKQTAALKEFVLAGDTLVQVTIRNLTSVMEEETSVLLDVEKDLFMQSYRRAVFGNASKINYESVKFYYDELTAYNTTEQLRLAVVQAAKSLAKAHSELAKNIREKKDLKDIIQQTQQMITDVQSVGSISLNLPHIKLP
jgi:hypothetical protein